MTVPNSQKKIKGVGKILLETAFFGILLGGAFLIGRISGLSEIKHIDNNVKFVYPETISRIPNSYQASKIAGGLTEPASWSFAGSITGKTYYPKGCKGLDRIKPENRLYFTTVEQATAAGYQLSSACAS